MIEDSDSSARQGLPEDDLPTRVTGEEEGSAGAGAAPPAVGHYRLIRSLGRGAQGEVFLAEDTILRRRVALKVLARAFAPSRDAIRRFQREAAAASRLDHPAICSIYEAGEADGIPYIAMRHVEGESLARRLGALRAEARSEEGTVAVGPPRTGQPEAERQEPASAGGPASSTDTVALAGGRPSTREEIHRIVAIIEGVARGLHAAHEAGLIHRDIKPGNIMISSDGQPVILDFGLARDEESQAQTLTMSGDLLGTPAYMSPEQLLAHRVQLDRRTDIYSLGVTLYECLTLQRPFDAPTREGLYQSILASNPQDPRKLNPQIPTDLEVIIETAIDRDRDRRYQSALDFAEDLRRFRDFEPIRARPAGPVLRFRRWVQRNPAIATGTLGLFVVLLTGLAISLVLLGRVRQEKNEKDAALVRLEHALELVETERDEKGRALADREQALRQIQRERDEKAALYLTARAMEVLHSNPAQALLLGLESARRQPSHLASGALVRSLEALHEERTLLGHRGAVKVASYSSDGARILTGGADQAARIWNAATGETVALLPGHAGGVTAAAFSPDGSRAATGSGDGVARIWDAGSGRRLAVLSGHEPWVRITSIVFSPDGRRVLTGSEDSTARIWDAASGVPLTPPLDAHESIIATAVFSPDGRRVLTSSGGAIKTFRHRPGGRVSSTRWTGKWRGTTARLWDAESGAQLHVLGDHLSRVAAAFSDGGKTVATMSGVGLRTFDAASGEERTRERPGGRVDLLRALAGAARTGLQFTTTAFSPGGGFAAASSAAGSIQVFELPSGRRLNTFATGGHPHVLLAIDRAGERVATVGRGSASRSIEVWDVASGRRLMPLDGHDDSVAAIEFSPDGSHLLSASDDGSARIWSLSGAGAVLSTRYSDTTGALDGAILSPDGGRLLARRGTLLIDTASGETIKEIKPPLKLGLFRTVPVDRASFTSDGTRLIATSRSGDIIVWEVASEPRLVDLPVLRRRFVNAALSAGGRFLADAHPATGAITVTELSGERRTRTLPGDGVPLTSMRFCSRRPYLATATAAGLVRLWDVAEAREAGRFTIPDAGPRSQGSSGRAPPVRVLVTPSPRGEAIVASAGRVRGGASLYLWTAARPETIRNVPVGGPVRTVRFSAGARRFLVVLISGELAIADTDRAAVTQRIAAQGAPILGAAFSPGGDRIVTIHEDSTARLWDLDEGEPAERAVLRGHEDRIATASFSPDGTLVVTASLDGTARIWNVAGGSLRTVLEEPAGEVRSALFSPDGKRIVTSSGGRSATLWDAATGKRTAVLQKRSFSMTVQGFEGARFFASDDIAPPYAFSGGGRRLVSARGNRVRVHDASTGDLLDERALPGQVRQPVIVALSDDGTKLALWARMQPNRPAIDVSMAGFAEGAVASVDGLALFEIRDVDRHTVIARRRSSGVPRVTRMRFSPRGDLIAMADSHGAVTVLDAATAGVVSTVHLSAASVRSIAFSADGSRLLAWTARDAVVSDARSGEEILAAKRPKGDLGAALLSADGGRVITADGDRIVHIWNVDTGDAIARLVGHVDDIAGMVLGPGDGSLATWSDSKVRVWDTASARQMISFPVAAVVSVRFSADGKRLLILDERSVRSAPLDVVALAESRKPRSITPDELDQHEVGTPFERERYRLRVTVAALRRDIELLERAGHDTASVVAELRTALGAFVRHLGDAPSAEEVEGALELTSSLVETGGRSATEILALHGRLQALAGDAAGAIATLETSLAMDPENAPARRLLAELRRRVWPDLVSFASIDALLDAPDVLVDEGDRWRYFRGTRDPAPGTEWASPDFDDGAWEEGPSGFGYGDGDDATVLDDMRGAYTTLYLRRAIDIPDPRELASVELDVRIDDGLVLYVNGTEVGRVRAGEAGTTLDHTSRAAETVRNATRHVLPVPAGLLRPGRNVVAIQALNSSPRSSDLTVIPVIVTRTAASAEAFRKRCDPFLKVCKDPDRVAYLDARLLLKEGKHAAAAAKLASLVSRRPEAIEPVLRLADALEASGEPDAAAGVLAAAFRRGLDARRLVERYFRICCIELREPLETVAARLPQDFSRTARDPVSREILWSFDCIGRHEAIRVNCGGEEYTDTRGRFWSADRFHDGGRLYYEVNGVSTPYAGDIAGTEDDTLYQTERWFPRRPGGPLPGYRIPLPPGTYRVTLHFAEIAAADVARRSFDVLLEGEAPPALTGYSPLAVGAATADSRQAAVEVSDGTLDIEFVHRENNPKVSAIEVERIGE